MARPQIWLDPPLPNGPPPVSSGVPLVDAILRGRGVTSAEGIRDWLDSSPRLAPEPGVFPSMEAAITRVVRAIDRGERIAVFGDYDADGVTSTAILALALTAATGDPDRVVTRLPERAEGYGLTVAAVDGFASAGIGLIVAVDCGSNDLPALGRARERGLDVVVLDHHKLTREVAEGEVVVNPQLRPDGVGTELTGAGLAYCFVAGLAREGVTVAPDAGERAYLDLAAVGTIADVGSLTGLNRPLVRDGIAQLRRTRWPGLRALMAAAGCSPATIDAEAIAFKLGPRLNAAGRVASPRVALELLTTADPRAAAAVATRVEGLNERRKKVSAEILGAATALVESGPGGGVPLAVAHAPGWPAGVMGSVATKLAEQLGAPAFVFSDGEDGLSVGSARSAGGFDLFGCLAGLDGLLVRFGGHAHAAGLTVATADLPRLVGAVTEGILRSGVAVPAPLEHRIDADLRPAELTLGTAAAIDRLAPFGAGNPAPLLRVRGARVLQSSRMGADRSHLRVVLDGPGGGIKAVMFGAGGRVGELARCPAIDLLAALEVDTWGGGERLGLKLVDFRSAG